ncbi:MAG: 3-phosphoshikimate 1-carboxyvinyltransferase [Candidatus Omnitrophota bacterium]|jgi:3-phosphoshikimate 1-carboxyvinyltransferase|nr:MAG: 3-phosphoshikimate 1-carboxyvinyltransferase [Candidatus Omnitrophota bacterium]
MGSFLIGKPLVRFKVKEISIPGDKSIAHRAIFLSSIGNGRVVIKNFPFNEDCLSTIKTFKQLGVKISVNKTANRVNVYGVGINGLRKPSGSIFIKESGATFRMLLGLLSGQKFTSRLHAGRELSKRPMQRVTFPLKKMGAVIRPLSFNNPGRVSACAEHPPFIIQGAELKGISYRMPVGSAQVKSALLLAGLYAQGQTTITDTFKSRDHTERMLKLFKARIKVKGDNIIIRKTQMLKGPKSLDIPGDMSSASFFIVLAAITPNSKVIIKNVSLNKTRSGLLSVLKRMGVNIKIIPYKVGWEPAGDIEVKSSRLKGVRIYKNEMPSLIDELPILMIAACYANSKTVFEGVNELRVKETDRIKSMASNLKKMGADIRVFSKTGIEYIVINGKEQLLGSSLRSFGDHRTAMSLIIGALRAKGASRIDDVRCINKSFPLFTSIIKSL